MNKFGLMLGKAKLNVIKFSPEIMVGSGIVGMVGAGVMACVATTKVEAIMEEHKKQILTIDECLDKVQEGVIEAEYTVEDSVKDKRIVLCKTGWEFTKAYGPAIVLGVASAASILGGYGIIKKRYVGVCAALATTQEGWDKYRQGVVERYGEQVDYELKNGIKAENITLAENEDGAVDECIDIKDVHCSQYARFFDEASTWWKKDANYNYAFLKSQQSKFNDLLKVRGHVFLNEVYDALDIPRSKEGSVVGWVYGNGDDFIDLGLDNAAYVANRRFTNGLEPVVLLDFNVDGVIYDLI